MDVSGEQQLDVEANLFKERLDIEGNPVTAEPEKQGLIRQQPYFTFRVIRYFVICFLDIGKDDAPSVNVRYNFAYAQSHLNAQFVCFVCFIRKQ